MFEWDEAKRRSNIDKHGLDFIRAALVFDGRPVLEAPARFADEPRILTIAVLDERTVAVVWTWRGKNRRLISFRKARDEERKRYCEVHG